MSVTLTGDGPNIALTGSGSSFTITVTTGSGGGGGGVTDHGALTGLADDDHPQYAKKASNLSDLTDTATARTNLGLGSAAVAATGDFEAAGAVGTHSADTTSVHGIADTSALETTTGAQAKVDAHVNDTVDAHDASAISVGTLNGNLSAVSNTDVEQALQAVDNLSLGGSVATDAIWDAAGDVVYGTGANTAPRLALGTRGAALVAGATSPEYAFITPRLNVPMATNDWVLLSTGFGTGSTGTTIGGTATSSNNNSRYVPFFVGKRIGVNGLGIEVSTGNAGGSAVIRLGIHANNAGRPGSVVVDAGTASAGAAAKELSFTEVFLDPGWYFAVVVFQDLDTAGTNPAVRGAAAMGSTATRTSVPAASTQQVSWSATVSGALSANPTVINTGALVIPHIWLKVSTL